MQHHKQSPPTSDKDNGEFTSKNPNNPNVDIDNSFAIQTPSECGDCAKPSNVASTNRSNGINTYVVECGLESVRYQPTQKMLLSPSLRYTSFHGACYICKCLAHSQKFCPLRRCNLCLQYGHADMYCPCKKKRTTR